MNENDTLRWLNVGLPEEIARLKAAGYYTQAIAQIDALLAEDWTQTQNGAQTGQKPANPMPAAPQALRDCLLAQRQILLRIPAEYPYTRDQALARLRSHIADATEAEFDELVAQNRIDCRFVEGELHFARRFYETLVDTDDTYARRAGLAPDQKRRDQRHAMAAAMQADGKPRAARITLQFALQPTPQAFAQAMARAKAQGRSKVQARVWLPAPAACPSQSEITLLGFSAPPTSIAPENAPQRTVYWETELAENTVFTAQYRYRRTARYVDPLGAAQPPQDAFLPPETCLGEVPPHLVFTPYLRALTAQVTAGAATPAEKARRIYDYLTLNVHYRYMPAYFVLEDIAENCARSRRGDCGVQALTFITMCRIAGIPAQWESGLSVRPQEAGCHDWAMFWLADQGWLYADCSFGGSAARNGDELLRRHYFGSLDTGRFAANHAFQAALCPSKQTWRADPYDNQTGEIELEGVGLSGSQTEYRLTVLHWEDEEEETTQNG